jgi:hypothetical protein
MHFAQYRLKWRLIVGFLLIVCIVNSAAKSDKKSSKNNQQKLGQQNQRLDEVQGSGQPPKGASIDDEVIRASGNNANPDDEDSLPAVEGSGQPPQNMMKPTPATTSKPRKTTTTETTELKIEDQDEDEDDDEDDLDDEEDENESPLLKPDLPETTLAPQTIPSTTTLLTTTSTPRQVFELTTRRPSITTNSPTFPSQVESISLDMLRPGLLAAISGGAVVGLLLTILLVMFIVYRMRKKDEGSYSLDEGTQHQPPHYSYAYQKAPTKEFYA